MESNAGTVKRAGRASRRPAGETVTISAEYHGRPTLQGQRMWQYSQNARIKGLCGDILFYSQQETSREHHIRLRHLYAPQGPLENQQMGRIQGEQRIIWKVGGWMGKCLLRRSKLEDTWWSPSGRLRRTHCRATRRKRRSTTLSHRGTDPWRLPLHRRLLIELRNGPAASRSLRLSAPFRHTCLCLHSVDDYRVLIVLGKSYGAE